MKSRHLISQDASLRQALKKLNDLSGGVMTLFVTDDEEKVLGALTDGDIRRALLAGASLDDTADKAMHREFRRIPTHGADVAYIRASRQFGIKLLPVVDGSDRLIDILDLTRVHNLLPLQAVLMAGGKGERLRPLTSNCPKPLLEIGGRPIIDHNIEALARCGIKDIFVTVNYMADRMRAHFSKPVAGADIVCVEEPAPLGTVGSAALCPLERDGISLVMNSDLLTDISFEDMYLHHIAQGADITVATIPYQVSVPFAILESDPSGRVSGIEEKPVYSYFANAGIYIFPNNMLLDLPTDRRTDATDLISDAVARGLKVVHFPISGTWLDVGTPTDYRQACEMVRFSNQKGS